MYKVYRRTSLFLKSFKFNPWICSQYQKENNNRGRIHHTCNSKKINNKNQSVYMYLRVLHREPYFNQTHFYTHFVDRTCHTVEQSNFCKLVWVNILLPKSITKLNYSTSSSVTVREQQFNFNVFFLSKNRF